MESERFLCGACRIVYSEYTVLVEHLYWRHGTESSECDCGMRRWYFAPHNCHMKPEFGEIQTEKTDFEVEAVRAYCLCGEVKEGSDMIACDGPSCFTEWFHFECVGVTTPPEGEWFCPCCVVRRGMVEAQLQKQKRAKKMR